jgi:hypothetical protein
MPNTLAHLGIQGITTQAFLRKADPKWIYLGCVIPDIPWILQRAILFAFPAIDTIQLRYYADVQASLLFCLILSAALALLTTDFIKTAAILGLNAFFHLLLDACQTKFANGVHFLAPLSWELVNFGWFWPESIPTYLLTGIGLAHIIWRWQPSMRKAAGFIKLSMSRGMLLIFFIAMYFTLPFFLVNGLEAADIHYVSLTHEPHNRIGQYIEFDRARYISNPSGAFLQSSSSEEFRVKGLKLPPPAMVSVRGIFINRNQNLVFESHVHSDWFRDTASYLGLALVTLIWILAFVKHRRV